MSVSDVDLMFYEGVRNTAGSGGSNTSAGTSDDALPMTGQRFVSQKPSDNVFWLGTPTQEVARGRNHN